LPGWHTYDISPDLRWAFHTYSRLDMPPLTELVSLPEHRVVRPLVTNEALTRNAATVMIPPAEFFTVPIGDGVTLDGWMIKPKDFDAAKTYPVLVYVYGEPAGQTVVDRWTGGRGFFHRALANEGFIVVSFDNRGTPAPKG